MPSEKVVAYYLPKTGAKVERHEMWRIDYDEAKKGPDGALWSLEAPKGNLPVEDHVPVPFDVRAQPESNPPPVVPRHSAVS